LFATIGLSTADFHSCIDSSFTVCSGGSEVIMNRSNAPLALSVVALTEPDSVERTLLNITQFDDRPFGFSHDRTWNVLPVALRGVFEPEAVGASLPNVPVRIQRCIKALCELGKKLKVHTYAFRDYPGAGLRPTTPIAWDPTVTVRVKGSCWFIAGGRPIIPLLQPRKSPLSVERMSVYLRLGRQAFCQGDWVDAGISLIDLSGDSEEVEARTFDECEIGFASDALLSKYVTTYTEAKKAADLARAERPREKPSRLPADDLFTVKK
jgi:hypothetical protein